MDWTCSTNGSGGRIVKKVYESKPEESRRRGNVTLRWLEDVEKDRCEMKVNSWRQRAVVREEWALAINLLKTKRNLLYIRNQFVPRCKHFPPRL